MPIPYYLLRNYLKKDVDSWYGHVSPSHVADYNRVVDGIYKLGSTLTKMDILAVLQSVSPVVLGLLNDGMSVSLPFAHFTTSITGEFDNTSDIFDKTRNQLNAKVRSRTRDSQRC